VAQAVAHSERPSKKVLGDVKKELVKLEVLKAQLRQSYDEVLEVNLRQDIWREGR
jgi:hypothetical protein